MKGINSNLSLLIVASIFLGGVTLLLLQRLAPLASHTVYYCKSVISTLTFSIPQYINLIPFVITVAIIVGVAAKLVFSYVKIQKMNKVLKKKRVSSVALTPLLKLLKIREKTYLIDSDKHFAFCLGLRNPKIYISTSLVSGLSTRELEAVLRHERQHIISKDSITVFLATFSESLLPFFPVLSDIIRNFKIEREIKADTVVTSELGDNTPLISVLRKLLVSERTVFYSSVPIADASTLEPRIDALLRRKTNFKHNFQLKRVILSIFSFVVMSFIITVPVRAYEIHKDQTHVIMVCPQGVECVNACQTKYQNEQKNYSEAKSYSSQK